MSPPEAAAGARCDVSGVSDVLRASSAAPCADVPYRAARRWSVGQLEGKQSPCAIDVASTDHPCGPRARPLPQPWKCSAEVLGVPRAAAAPRCGVDAAVAARQTPHAEA